MYTHRLSVFKCACGRVKSVWTHRRVSEGFCSGRSVGCDTRWVVGTFCSSVILWTHFYTHGNFTITTFGVLFCCARMYSVSVSILGSCGDICKGPWQRRNSSSSWVQTAETQSADGETKYIYKIHTALWFWRPTAATVAQKRSTHISSEVQRTRPDSQIKSGTCQLLRQAGSAAPRLIKAYPVSANHLQRHMYWGSTF